MRDCGVLGELLPSSGAGGTGTPLRSPLVHRHEHKGCFGAVQDTRHHTAPLTWAALGASSACRHRARGRSTSPCPALGSCQLRIHRCEMSARGRGRRGGCSPWAPRSSGGTEPSSPPAAPGPPLPGQFCPPGQPKHEAAFRSWRHGRTGHEGSKCRGRISSPCRVPSLVLSEAAPS